MAPKRERGFFAHVSRAIAGRSFFAQGFGRFRATDRCDREPASRPNNDLPVYDFDDVPTLPAHELRQLFGGKAAGLIDMRRLGIPVPPGFVLGTELCRRFLASGWPAGLDDAIEARLASLERATGQRLGGGQSPLLVSVRSGAPVSMPGMMDTILNLGANRQTITALAARTQDERFALDTWSRFSRMYAATVLGMSADMLGDGPWAGADAAALRADVDAVHSLCVRLKTPIPDDPRQQLRGAIEAVFRSSCSERARIYREREGIAQDVPTAVVVQAMVFGNMGVSSGSGVAFSRNPSTGAKELCGDFLINGQGEDVVSGRHAPEPLAAMATCAPDVCHELAQIMRSLEQHTRDLCDVEFTVQQGRLHILQVRAGKRSAAAAARIAMEMASDDERLITRDEAVRRVTRDQLRQLQSAGRVRVGVKPVASGVAASPGVASGVICLHPDRVAALAATAGNVILVRPTTSPQDVHGMVKAVGIVTATGGMVSHAALVARGWGIAAVCGIEDLQFAEGVRLGGVELKEGDRITIDGGSGAVYLGDCVEVERDELPELQTLRLWASELGIELGCDDDRRGMQVSGGAADATIDAFAVMRALALLGFATDERIAVSLAIPAEAVRRAIDGFPPGHLNRTARGLQVAPDGRAWLHACLDAERDGIDRAAADRAYQAFMSFDHRFKHLVTDWQMKTVNVGERSDAVLRTALGQTVANDHADPAYDAAVRCRLGAFHRELLPLLSDICALAPRLQPFRSRLARASAAVEAGDGTMIASPLKDSFHTVWFELHEELIHLTGRDRASVEANSSPQRLASPRGS
jgi:pyruvate,orthophosphate dikinase